MWIYHSDTGQMYDPAGTLRWTGYAGGNEGRNPEGINNVSMEGIKSIGPLPRGLYSFGQPIMQSHLGPFAIPLTPSSSNNMLGRGDFFLHGDTTPSGNASMGCIILNRATRNAMWASTDHQLQVVSS
jgi:Protein of unknown function (DUF2778)